MDFVSSQNNNCALVDTLGKVRHHTDDEKKLSRGIERFGDLLLRAHLRMPEFARRKQPDFTKENAGKATEEFTKPRVILVDGTDQTGKTYLINELIRRLGENNCAHFHNVYYDNFRAAHAAILSVVKEIRDKPYVIVDRWHLSHILHGQIFKNAQYDENDSLFVDIDAVIDNIIICAVSDYEFNQNLRQEKLPDTKKQKRTNQLFLDYANNCGDKRFVLYDYREYLTHEKLKKFVADFIERLKSE